EPHPVGERVTYLAESCHLAVERRVVVVVNVAGGDRGIIRFGRTRIELSAVVARRREAKQGVEHLIDVGGPQLLDAALLRHLPEDARSPGPSRVRFCGLPTQLL